MNTSRPPFAYLLVTAVSSGALVLTIEVMGSRVIGPFFGVSLFVWTSLVTVTLLALALGYAVGGQIADRFPAADALYLLVLLAAVFVLIIPAIKEPVLRACVGLGIRAGALAASMMLFGPALFALGCVSPLLVRNAAPEARNLGRTVGSLYAVSTLGSVAGALVTGYVLIGLMGVDAILRASACVLTALSLGYFVAIRRRWSMLPVAALLLIPGQERAVVELQMPDGTMVRQIATSDSAYGTVKVVDYRFGSTGFREMTIDGLVQGAFDARLGLPVYEYAYLMQYLPLAIHPSGKRCLTIGLGAGIVPRWYEAQGVVTDVVDIDPVVLSFARQYFEFRPRGDVFIADARHFLTSTRRTYDYVILDVFNGDTTPGHILSQEALQQIKLRVEKRGVVAFNIIGSLHENTFMTASIVRTVKTVFDQVDVYPTFEPQKGDGTGNLVVLAYDGAPRDPDRRWLRRMPVHPLAASVTSPGMFRSFEFGADVPAMVITDDFNPLDVHDAWLRERVRQGILDTTHWSLLLGAARPQQHMRTESS